MNHNRTVPTRNGGVVDHYVVIRQSADAVETNLEWNLFAAIEEPAVGAARLDGHVTGCKCFEVLGFGTEGQANFPGNGVAAGNMLDAGTGLPKRVAARIAFEMMLSSRWSTAATFPELLRPPSPKCLPRQ